MSLLEKALDVWCANIHKVCNVLKFKYDENSVYGFKNNEETGGAYEILRAELRDLELTYTNMNAYIFQIFCRVDPMKIGKTSFYFLNKMVFFLLRIIYLNN